jgi:hypothetical protein
MVMVPLAFFSAILILFLLSDGTVSPSLAAALLVVSSCVLTVIVLTEVSLLAGLVVLALAGATQAATAIWFPSPITLYMDNLPFILIVIYTVTLAVQWRFVAELRILGIVVLLVAIALVRAGITSAALYQARQILVPFLVAFAAYLAVRLPAKNPAYKPRIDILIQFSVGLAFVTCIYMLIEYVWGPPLNPLAAYQLNPFTEHFAIIDGYLGNYLFYPGNTGHFIIRLGGPLMDPPVTGIFIGGAAVIAFWQYWHRRHLPMLILFVASTLAVLGTYARGGMLVAVVGIGFPLLIRYTNRTLAVTIVMLVAVYIGAKIGQEGSSVRHYDGLIAGLTRALHHPFGQGLDVIGDVTKRSAGVGEGESLAAIPFAAIGLPAVVLYLATLWGLLRSASFQNWPAALGLGMLLCTLFTESASSLAGTVVVWSFCGVGLALATKQKKSLPDGVQDHRHLLHRAVSDQGPKARVAHTAPM